jgi:hypothetical protein
MKTSFWDNIILRIQIFIKLDKPRANPQAQLKRFEYQIAFEYTVSSKKHKSFVHFSSDYSTHSTKTLNLLHLVIPKRKFQFQARTKRVFFPFYFSFTSVVIFIDNSVTI